MLGVLINIESFFLQPRAAHRLDFDSLGLAEEQKQALLQAIHQPNGMVLITGPTGSGKTLTLYSCLEHINREEVNISCVEDPCEIYLAGANQVSIHERAGLTFANARDLQDRGA